MNNNSGILTPWYIFGINRTWKFRSDMFVWSMKNSFYPEQMRIHRHIWINQNAALMGVIEEVPQVFSNLELVSIDVDDPKLIARPPAVG